MGSFGVTPLAGLSAVVLDTETTGLDARTAKIIQIGAVRVESGRITSEDVFDHLVNPGIAIPAITTGVHGIADKDVASAPAFGEVAGALAGYIGTNIVVGHTIGYDLTILQREFAACGRTWVMPRSLDIRLLAEIALPSLAQYDLDRIASALGLTIVGRHTAMGDARATAECFVSLIARLRERNIRTLAETEAAMRDLADRRAGGGQNGVFLPPASDMRIPLARIDSFPYRHRVADLMSAPSVWCDASTTVGNAVRLIVERGISSVLVRGSNGDAGIATERDLLRCIDREGTSGLQSPVGNVASRPLHTIQDSDFVYRAIGRIGRLGIRHLAVVDSSQEIVGMVTTRNLLRHRATTAIVLGDAIDVAADEGILARVWGQLMPMARGLVDEDVEPRTIVAVVSTEICALTRRACELAEQAMIAAGKGAAPVPFAVLVLGSAGRGESLLAADQDNAIVHAAATADGPEDRWFAEMASEMNRILDVAGVPLCKGGVMAKNTAWRGTTEAWLARVESWVRRQRPEDLLNVDIFFDGVVVHGNMDIGNRIMNHAYALAERAPDFQLQLSLAALRWHAPVSMFGTLKTDGDGRLDLKKHGLLPIVTAARMLAIRHGVHACGTADRLRAVNAAGIGAAPDIDAVIEAQAILLRFMLRQQLADGVAGIALSPRVDVKSLDANQKADLKGALQRVGHVIDLVSEGRI